MLQQLNYKRVSGNWHDIEKGWQGKRQHIKYHSKPYLSNKPFKATFYSNWGKSNSVFMLRFQYFVNAYELYFVIPSKFLWKITNQWLHNCTILLHVSSIHYVDVFPLQILPDDQLINSAECHAFSHLLYFCSFYWWAKVWYNDHQLPFKHSSFMDQFI